MTFIVPRTILLFVFIVSPLQGAIRIDDGGEHTIATNYVNETFIISNQSAVTHQGNITTNILDFSRPPAFTVQGGSELTIDGGQIQSFLYSTASLDSLNVQDGSTVTVNSGEIVANGMSVANSTFRINGGRIDSTWNADASGGGFKIDNSNFIMTNGDLSYYNEAAFSFGYGLRINHSNVRISGGSITGRSFDGSESMLVDGQSNVVITGGQLTASGDASYGVVLLGSSKLEISGGVIKAAAEFSGQGVHMRGLAELTMRGGRIDSGGFNVFGLTGFNAADTTVARILDGEIEISGNSLTTSMLFSTSGSAKVEVQGGTFKMGEAPSRTLFQASESSTVRIAGGTFILDGPFLGLRSSNQAEIFIEGSGFNYPLFEPIQDRSGTVTGRLADGTAIAWTFARDPGAKIILVPEPAACMPYLLGVSLLWRFRQRRCVAC